MNRLMAANFDGKGHVDLKGENGAVITLQVSMIAELWRLAQKEKTNMLRAVAGAEDWHQVSDALEPKTADVGVLATTSGQRVALILDRGLATESTVSFDQSAALALSQEFAATAARIESNKPVKQ